MPGIAPSIQREGTQLKTSPTHLILISHSQYAYQIWNPILSNTLDIALINNFNFPYDITSISDLSSDHNPVILKFSLCNITHMDKTRAISTCWSTFHKNLDKNIHFADMLNINNPHTLEEKINHFTDAVRSAYSQVSKPITRKTHSYTPQSIKDLITLKNRARKLYHNTLNPIYRTEANRLQAHIKKQVKIHTQQVWTDRLKALNTQDNSIWQIQKNFRISKSSIPTLTHNSGIATSDDQKANALATSFKSNYTENKRPDNFTNNIDSDVTLTLENFFANPPTTPLVPTNTEEYATDQSQCLLSPISSQQTSTGFPPQTPHVNPPPTSYHHVIYYVTPASQSGRCASPSWFHHFTGSAFTIRVMGRRNASRSMSR
ncbi:uncharacterized protein TNCV_1579041 [Trichonephila clavipes]|nr:uncharacterized protein TNCV_1579041 [Trichonephila clavipes]